MRGRKERRGEGEKEEELKRMMEGEREKKGRKKRGEKEDEGEEKEGRFAFNCAIIQLEWDKSKSGNMSLTLRSDVRYARQDPRSPTSLKTAPDL